MPKIWRLVGGINLKPGTFFGVDIVETKNMDAFLKDKKPDVLIDFTIAHAAVENVRIAARNNVAVIVGTTGFTADQRAEMAAAIEGHVPAVISSNFSVGVNIFWQLIRDAGKLLKDYDIEVIEAHHRNKKDAPSGTAKTILQILDEEVGTRNKLVRARRYDGAEQRDWGSCDPRRGYCRGPQGDVLEEFRDH